MKNWPKSKKKFWQSLRINSTKRILQFGKKLKKPKLKLLCELKGLAEYHLHPDDHN